MWSTGADAGHHSTYAVFTALVHVITFCAPSSSETCCSFRNTVVMTMMIIHNDLQCESLSLDCMVPAVYAASLAS